LATGRARALESPDFRGAPKEFGLAGTLALPHLGLLDSGADRQGIGAHFHALLGLLAGLGRVLTLNKGLVDDSGWLVHSDSLAAFEGPRAGAAGREQREREPDGEEGGETFDGGGEPNR
jgi:hypothetical protein